MTKTLYFTYILECSDGSLYIGKTTDITHRIRAHNGEVKGGAKYTRSKRPVILRLIEEFKTHKEAAQREWELKQLTHSEKKKILRSKIDDQLRRLRQ